jgi:plastocyanin
MRASMTIARNPVLPLATILSLVGCGGDDGPSEPTNGGADVTVTVQNNNFSPSSAAVAVNGTVVWQWNSGGVAHNVTFADPGIPGSGDRTSGTFERTFSTAGSFAYQCTIHAGMTGSVNVTTGGTGGGGGGGDDGGGYP